MTARYTRLLFSVVLLAIGSLNLVFYTMVETKTSGEAILVLPKYVSPGFQLATLVGGLGLLVVGAFLILTNGAQSGCGHDHHADDHAHGEEHDHGEMNPIVALLILSIPVVFSVYYTEHKFTESELSRRSEADVNPEMFEGNRFKLPPFSLETLDKYKKKNSNGAYQMGVMELFLTGGDPEVSQVLDGLKVEVEGAVRSLPGDEGNASVKRMYRMMMQCCAADMQAIPVKLYLPDEVVGEFNYKEHAWLKVEANLGYEVDRHGNKQAVLKVLTMEETAPPDTEILLSGKNSVMQDKL